MTDGPQEWRLLQYLEKNPAYMPTLRKREPFWRPKPPPVADRIHVPTWKWAYELEPPEGLPLVDLDVNAGYLAAASSAPFAHGPLEHTGPRPDGATIDPGYYLVDAHWWADLEIVSPLGNNDAEAQVWIAAPTLQLLRQLVDDGYWPDAKVYDSWTCPTSVRFRRWSDCLKGLRAGLIERGKGDPYEDFKTAYSMAVSMMLTGDKCRTRRPDWAHTIYAQHAANTWRKAWRAKLAGCNPVRMGDVDEVTFTVTDYQQLIGMATPPFRIDQDGITLGSFKIKRTYKAGDSTDDDE